MAVITNFHQFSGLKQQKFVLLHFWRSEVLKSRRHQGNTGSFWRLCWRICLLAFSKSFQRLLAPVARASSSIFKPTVSCLQISVILGHVPCHPSHPRSSFAFVSVRQQRGIPIVGPLFILSSCLGVPGSLWGHALLHKNSLGSFFPPLKG